MLVLSRKQNETIVFPNLGISVEILRVAGRSVSVGVRAPEKFQILRGELAKNGSRTGSGFPVLADSRGNHDLRNRLNKASLALHLAQKQIQAGKMEDAEQALSQALDFFAELDRMSAGGLPRSLGKTPIQSAAVESKPLALLVEDDDNERELLAGYLRLCGYEVETACNGLLAVEYLQSQSEKPQVVVMDMQMPQLDGGQTVQAIRNNPLWDDIQLIVVSGTKQADMHVPSGDRGVSRWFEKPLRPDELLSHLASLN